MNTTVTFESDVDVETRRQTLKNLLESNHVVVEFTKVNGDHRSMPCTLKEGMIPAVTSSEFARPANPEIMSVWSTDNSEWRSFRLSNVISAQIHA